VEVRVKVKVGVPGVGVEVCVKEAVEVGVSVEPLFGVLVAVAWAQSFPPMPDKRKTAAIRVKRRARASGLKNRYFLAVSDAKRTFLYGFVLNW
jgi:hypothetical protein